jgi:hypothetical protein
MGFFQSTKIYFLLTKIIRQNLTVIFVCANKNGHYIPHFARHCAQTTRHIKWGWNRVRRKNILNFRKEQEFIN